VETQPPVTSINQANVYNSDATAIAALTGIYSYIQKIPYPITGNASISVFLQVYLPMNWLI